MHIIVVGLMMSRHFICKAFPLVDNVGGPHAHRVQGWHKIVNSESATQTCNMKKHKRISHEMNEMHENKKRTEYKIWVADNQTLKENP